MDVLNYKKVKEFWENRYKRINVAGDLYLANLSDNIPLQAIYKDKLEKQIISNKVYLTKDMDVLDLGCGTGRMALFFAKKCKHVTAIDFSANLLKIAANKIKSMDLDNIKLIQQSIANFHSNHKFDIIFIGGVLSFLNDIDVENVVRNIKDMLKENGKLIIRDSLRWRKRCVLKEKFINNFKDDYSIIYRTIGEIKRVFKKNTFYLNSESSLAVFPFMGLYHYPIRLIAGKSKIYSKLSKIYFGLVYRFIPYIRCYKNMRFYKVISYLLNRYDQRFFIYFLKNRP